MPLLIGGNRAKNTGVLVGLPAAVCPLVLRCRNNRLSSHVPQIFHVFELLLQGVIAGRDRPWPRGLAVVPWGRL
jgi:hypothetical protein